jgi:hypothetical protein
MIPSPQTDSIFGPGRIGTLDRRPGVESAHGADHLFLHRNKDLTPGILGLGQSFEP